MRNASKLRLLRTALVSIGLAAWAVENAHAQEFPTRPIKMVLATGPGTISDLIARTVSTKMSESLGQPIVLDHRPGAGNVVGFEFAAKQAPNGYTILLLTVSQLALMPVTVKDLRFDAMRDLPPFIGLAEGRSFLIANAKFAPKSFHEMVEYAKANPGKVRYSSVGASVQLPVEAIRDRHGLNMLHVPYSKPQEGYLAIATGEVDMGIVSEANVISFGERIRILALSGAQRSPKYPNAPTFTEVGFPLLQGFKFSLNAPRGVPQPILNKLSSAASYSLKQADIIAQLRKLDLDIVGQPADEATKELAALGKFFGELASKIGMKPQ